jgi:ferrous iron transport protein A
MMTLLDAQLGEEYIVKEIVTDDEELDAFLFSLGCYSGEPITVVSRKKSGCVVSIKDGRYNIDNQLAEAIMI